MGLILFQITNRPSIHFTDRRISVLLYRVGYRLVTCTLAAGFKTYYPTEHATIAWSDRAIEVYIINTIIAHGACMR